METLLVGVLVPIVVGPLSIYLKSLWDRYNEKKDLIKINRYNAKINLLDKKINTFYWPVYLKLKCLYRLNYKYHNQNINKNVNQNQNQNINQNIYTDTSDDNQIVKNIIEEHKKKRLKRKKKKKDYINKIKANQIESPSTTDIDFMNDESSMSSDSDETKHRKISVEVGDVFLNEIDKRVINLSKEIKELIESNISIIQPNETLINEIIKFVRFTEMEIIVFNVNCKNLNRKYNYQDMGVVNNTKNLYKIIEKELYLSIEQYNTIFHDFNKVKKIKRFCRK